MKIKRINGKLLLFIDGYPKEGILIHEGSNHQNSKIYKIFK